VPISFSAFRVCSTSQQRSYGTPCPCLCNLAVLLPRFVECAFQQHYSRTTLGVCDSICIWLDIVIWLCCILASWRTPKALLCTVPTLLTSLGLAVFKQHRPAQYNRHRTAITVFRRCTIHPYLALILRQPLHATGSWPAAFSCRFLHLFVLSGSVHTVIASFYFLNKWWTTLFEVAVSAVALGSAAPAACRNVLAGPQSRAGWQAAAELFDKAALNIYSNRLQEPRLEHAVCCTTLNTVLVSVDLASPAPVVGSASCLAGKCQRAIRPLSFYILTPSSVPACNCQCSASFPRINMCCAAPQWLQWISQ
jgi:hypothetical protein